MKPEFENTPLIKNDTQSRFQITVDGYTAFILFKEIDKDISLIHTESPEEIGGRGVATALIEKTLIYLEQHNYILAPLCPLVYAYIKRHPEWKRIVREDFKDKF